jgi:selenocysteine-specific elongation factor
MPTQSQQAPLKAVTPVRKNIMLGTAGHVDHGKTALVKLLTGCETDTLAEEKQRGLTIDLGFAPCRLSDNRVVGVVDVPGHVDFIRNMVAGAHGVDVVIFAVAADDGLMPQTHEHLAILTLMGLRHGLVALTKIDLVSIERRAARIEEIRRLLAKTFLADCPICPISNLTGEGFDGFFDALDEVVRGCEPRPCSGPFGVWVEDVFTLRGQGTVITGIPSSGSVRIGQRLELQPCRVAGHVRRMQVYGEDAAEGRAGECVALNLPEVDHLAVKRGMLLCTPETMAPVSMAEAELCILDSVRNPVEDFLEAHLHVGTASVMTHVALLEAAELAPGQKQMVQLRLSQPLPLRPGERFVLRANLPSHGQSGLTTIGGGRILGVSNTRLRRKRPWTLSALAARRDALGDPAAWCEQMLRESPTPLSLEELRRRCLMRPEEMATLMKSLEGEGRVARLPGGALVHPSLIETAGHKMLSALQAFHAANPQRAGMEREELFATASAPPEVCATAAARMVKAGRLEQKGTIFAQAGWSIRLPDPDQHLCEQVAAAFRNAGWAGPSPAELSGSLGWPAERIDKWMRLLAERGVLIRLPQGAFIHREALEAAKQVALGLFRKRASFSTMDYRDALGVSRKYAVPLLDYLDAIRFTVRCANQRTPGAEARKLLGGNAQ